MHEMYLCMGLCIYEYVYGPEKDKAMEQDRHSRLLLLWD